MTKKTILFAKKQPSIFFDDFIRPDGVLGQGWISPTWAISGNKVINTPSLGSDLISNGGFASDTVWAKGTGWTIAAGLGTHAASGGVDTISQTPITSTLWYRMVWTITAITAGVFNARIGNSAFLGPNRATAGTFLDTRRANTTTAAISAGTTGAGSVDNVSCKLMPLADLFATRALGKNGYVQALWTAVAGTQFGVVMCLDNPTAPANFVVAYYDGAGKIVLAKCVAGVYTELISTATLVSYGDGKNIKLNRIPGTNTFQVFYGVAGSEVQIGTNQTISDPGIVNNIYGGIFSTYEGNSCDGFAYSRDYDRANWNRQTVLSSSVAWEQTTCAEANVIYETGAQILSGTVYKMWYTGGWGSPSIGYAESLDGITWTKYASNPVLTAHCRSSVFKDGSTYYMFTAPTAQTTIDLYTSTDGITWTLDTAVVLTLGAGGQWDDQQIANTFVWKESANDWRMIYEAKRSGASWSLGYATSPDGRVWTKSGSNPVVTGPNGTRSCPWLTKVGSTYYLWLGGSTSDTVALPTDIYRYTSTDLISWVPFPAYPLLARIGAAEGAGTTVGQVADPFILVRGGLMYLFYTGSSNGTLQAGAQHIVLAIADLVGLTG